MKKKRELSPLEQKLNGWVDDHLTRITTVERIFFVDHLRTMLHAGLSLVEALNVLAKESAKKKLQNNIKEIKSKVEKGQALSEVLENYPQLFPPIYVKMVASGEISGKLEESLQQITVQMKKNHELTSSVRGAMIYPTVIVAAMVVVAVIMMIFVLPKMMMMFDDFGGELPLATKILVGITNFVSQPINLVLIFGLVGLVIGGFIMTLKKVPAFKKFVHKFNLHWPIFGIIIKHINLARFSLTLSSLLKSTLPIVQAINITADTCSNRTYRNFLHVAAKKVKTGTPLSEILNKRPDLFPPMVTEMIMVGEKTGEVDRLLAELSEFYSKDVDKTMKNFSTIIEPVIILGIGVAVAGLAVAVIMPMYSLTQQF